LTCFRFRYGRYACAYKQLKNIKKSYHDFVDESLENVPVTEKLKTKNKILQKVLPSQRRHKEVKNKK
jgi:hypothetical protein